VVAYADEVKSAALGVDPAVIARHGAVSPEVARQMAQGARTRFGAHLALAITGIAGPEGGTREKPVGLVWVGAAWVDAGGREFAAAARRFFASDRIGNRRLAAIAALEAASQIAAEFLS
jgi:PncC family amidohydrolase